MKYLFNDNAPNKTVHKIVVQVKVITVDNTSTESH